MVTLLRRETILPLAGDVIATDGGVVSKLAGEGVGEGVWVGGAAVIVAVGVSVGGIEVGVGGMIVGVGVGAVLIRPAT